MSDIIPSDKQLLEQIASRTETIHKKLRDTNPYDLPSETRPVYQEISDEVRSLNTDVRVALRNYDKLYAFYQEHQQADVKLSVVA